MNSSSLYELLGIQDFSTTETVRLRIDEMELKHGEDFSKNIPEHLVSRVRTAAHVLKHPGSKQYYDVLLRAKSGDEPTLPRFANSDVEDKVLALAKSVGIELTRAGELTYRVGNLIAESRSAIPQVETMSAIVGQQEIEFSSAGFRVDSSLIGQPTKIALYSEPPEVILVDLPDRLRLQTGNKGTFIFASIREMGSQQLFAAGVNRSLRCSTYMPQAAQHFFGGDLNEIGNLFGVRAKKQRIQDLILQFHKELAKFAEQCSADFFNSLREQVLISYVKENSYLF